MSLMQSVETKVKHYLDKIKKEDNKINAFLEINPNALEEAKAIDAKKKKEGSMDWLSGLRAISMLKGLQLHVRARRLRITKRRMMLRLLRKLKLKTA